MDKGRGREGMRPGGKGSLWGWVDDGLMGGCANGGRNGGGIPGGGGNSGVDALC